MYMTNQQILEETKLIIATHAPRILAELGLEQDTHILGNILASSRIGEDTPQGVCNVMTRTVGRGAFVNSSYVPESASITLYPFMHLHYLTTDGELKAAPFFARFMKPIIRKLILTVLAHELRHYWQHVTGAYQENELQFFGGSLMGYEFRWCERDANKFAEQYVLAQ